MKLPFVDITPTAIPLTVIPKADYSRWLERQDEITKSWLTQHDFNAEAGSVVVIRHADGSVNRVVAGQGTNFWQYAQLANVLPAGTYHLQTNLDRHEANFACVAWALAHYSFETYKTKKSEKKNALVWPAQAHQEWVKAAVTAITQARDLINTPAVDLTPLALADVVKSLAGEFKATCTVVAGKELEKNYPAIHTVGKAAAASPCLIDLKWDHPYAVHSLTLVGKGVTFDSGGLDIKPSSGMLTMKKDMGGAAYVIALARLIMHLNYPLTLRVLIPAAENAISGNAMRPMDIITTKKGTTVEVGNTDAEGRLILADALTEAIATKPDLIIDCATLTGAARIALGTELPGFFCNNVKIAQKLSQIGEEVEDPLWQLPLFQPYQRQLKSPNADLNSVGKGGYGGAIVAALFLEHFVEETPWVHVDTMGWNLNSQPGRPEGGDIMGWFALAEFVARWAS